MSELYHHGIKGQKWGVQNGPPYPLNLTKSQYKELSRITLSKNKRLKKEVISGTGGAVAIGASAISASKNLDKLKGKNSSNRTKATKVIATVGTIVAALTMAYGAYRVSEAANSISKEDKSQVKYILNKYEVESMDELYDAMNRYEKEHHIKRTDYYTRDYLH